MLTHTYIYINVTPENLSKLQLHLKSVFRQKTEHLMVGVPNRLSNVLRGSITRPYQGFTGVRLFAARALFCYDLHSRSFAAIFRRCYGTGFGKPHRPGIARIRHGRNRRMTVNLIEEYRVIIHLSVCLCFADSAQAILPAMADSPV